VIAHRLKTVQTVDRILVLHAGRVVQEGDHAALMAAEGPYRQMVVAYRGMG
jgi:ABC-type multidrug transport system fused ATPase/permease subunit